MIYSLSFLSEVEEDALGGYEWYEAKAAGLGEEFLRMFYASASDIPRNPHLYRKVYKDFCRCLIRRFPYSIYFTVREQQVIVVGLFHCARNPAFWKKQLRDRKNANP